MVALANERMAYFNGEIVPESRVVIPFRDRGFKLGDAVFDVARTFGGKPFKLKEHVERLYRSLSYTRIDPGLDQDEMIRISEEVLARNAHLLDRDEDYWIGQWITRGSEPSGGDLHESTGPLVIVDCNPLPLKARAALYRDGIPVVFPSIRRIPPECLSPNAKTLNYLNLVMGDQEVRIHDPGNWSVLLDTRGYLCEGTGSNIFLVRDGVVLTPKHQYVLAGVSRQTVIELAEDQGIPVREEDLTPYDAATADEAFITSTSFCLCPVRGFNGGRLGAEEIPGPVTKLLSDAYCDLVGFDFVGQFLKHLT